MFLNLVYVFNIVDRAADYSSCCRELKLNTWPRTGGINNEGDVLLLCMTLASQLDGIYLTTPTTQVA